MNEKTSRTTILIAVVIAATVFVLDLSMPLGVAGGVPYVALILMGLWCSRISQIYFLAALGSALTIIGYFASPSGGILWVVVTNRGLALFIIWITAFLIVYRKRAETSQLDSDLRHNAIVNSALDGIIIIDEVQRVLEFNPAAETIFGLRGEEMRGKDISEIIIPPHLRDRHHQAFNRYLATSEAHILGKRVEVTGMRSDGEEFPLELTLTTFKQSENRLFIAFIRDITERKKTQERLVQAKEEADEAKEAAEDANLVKSRFLSSMSHELRTPLNAIIGFGQLLQHSPKEPLTPTQKEYTNDIIYSGEMLLELINGVLDLARIEAGQLHLSMEDVYTDNIIDDCITMVLPSAEKSDITITNRTATQSPLLIHTDALRLKQVLLNLLSNAVKYNNPGGTVTFNSVKTDDGYLHISVTDTGLGIAPEHLADIFKPFDRLGIEAKTTTEGTGIGLTVTKELVERMGGRIGFESFEYKGSTFWVEIPLASRRSKLLWNDNLSIGIQQVDDDHKVLIALLNELSESNLDTSEMEGILGKLIDYTLYHFRREETLMAACSYPHLEDHRRVHHHLAAKARQFVEKWHKDGGAEVIQELLEFLRTWLVNHIMQDDAEIVPFAKGKEAEIEQALEKLSNTE